jgi:hypothetical protein
MLRYAQHDGATFFSDLLSINPRLNITALRKVSIHDIR